MIEVSESSERKKASDFWGNLAPQGREGGILRAGAGHKSGNIAILLLYL
uniref:Uncharacterized protein n=1 Tax=uncultured bacterium contig00085 TaxID=1181558 RepID=A0A806JZV4_9BACT|nr:hypothetical protein [uncultured bacterium contig00085]